MEKRKREEEKRRERKKREERKNGERRRAALRPLSTLSSSLSLFPLCQAGASDVVLGALDGYNGTVLAYGQTGSGKTHTMIGEKRAFFHLKTSSWCINKNRVNAFKLRAQNSIISTSTEIPIFIASESHIQAQGRDRRGTRASAGSCSGHWSR